MTNEFVNRKVHQQHIEHKVISLRWQRTQLCAHIILFINNKICKQCCTKWMGHIKSCIKKGLTGLVIKIWRAIKRCSVATNKSEHILTKKKHFYFKKKMSFLPNNKLRMKLLTCPDHAHALEQAWQRTGMHCQHCSPLLQKFHNKEYCLWKHTTPLLSSQKPVKNILIK